MNTRVLVVDDKSCVREVVHEILDSEYEVIEAVDGGEALTKLKCHTDISVVLLDVCMPAVDGWETLAAIRGSTSRWPDLKVVMLTVAKDPETVMRAWGEGATYYLPKPFSRLQLLETVKRCLAA